MKKPIKILVVDDHEMVRKGLIAYLETIEEFEVIGEAENGEESIKFCSNNVPDIVLMDLIMEKMNGIEAIKEIRKIAPDVKIIILTSYMDEQQIFPALENGAISYLLKTAKGEEIIQAIHKTMNGESIIEPKVATKMLTKLKNEQPSHHLLTKRELEVLKLIGIGKSNFEIAGHLFIGIKTVKTHVSNILSKLEVDDRTQAAIYAYKHHLVD